MQKIKVNRKYKIALIIACSFIFIVVSSLLYIEYKVPKFNEEKKAVYSYKSKTDINHHVNFIPNMLYDGETLPDDDIFLTNYVDSINALFQYQFTGERVAEISGSYQITAEVEGYTIQNEKHKTIWKKLYKFLPEKSFQENSTNLTIQEDISVNPSDFNNFVDALIKETKVNSDSKLTITMDINLNANTDKGKIEEKVSPSIVIPLNTNYIEIVKNIPEEKEAAIEETRQLQIPVNNTLVIIYSVLLGLMLIILLCLIFLTISTEKDMFTKALKKIFKKHGSRLVALNSNIPGSFKDYIKVKAIGDLVRIADEIGKPIMYKYSADPKEISQFYVWDENQIYIFDLKEAVKKQEMEKSQKVFKKPRIKREKNKKGASGQEKVVINTSK